jgi:hypothetical protein
VRRPASRRPLALSCLLPLVLLTGCGGGDDSPKSDPSPTQAAFGKAAYLARAEALCTEANEKIDAQPEPQTLQQLVPSFQETLQIADDYTTKLEQLAVAQPDKAKLDTIFLTPLRGQVTALRNYIPDVEAAVAKGEAAIQALPAPEVPEADLKAMRAYGFKSCVETADDE